MATPSSVFTFESTVHSSHVLQWLDEQRCRDMLCDVTVAVEGQRFRAHCSVLASCSEYFAQRISSLAQHGAVISLPEEVTVVGFEPLLKFAYTSKLHFGKDDVLEIQHSASVLGFKDLDEACFDFLLPKLFSSNKSPAPFVRKTCCKKTCKRRFTKENGGADSDDVLLDDKEVKPVADSSSQQDTAWGRSKSVKKKTGSLSSAVSVGPPVEEMDVAVLQCPKYRKFQLACEKGGNEKSLTDPLKSRVRDPCALSCFPCSSSARCKIKTPPKDVKGGAEEPQKSETHETKTENSEAPREVDPAKKDALEGKEKLAEDNFQEKMEHSSCMSPLDISSIKIVSPESSPMLSESSSELSLPHCPLSGSNEERVICRQHEKTGTNITENQETMNPAAPEPGSVHQNVPTGAEGKSPYSICQDGGKGGETGSIERAAILIDNTRERSAREKDKGDQIPKSLGLSKGQQTFHDFQAGCSSNAGSRWVQSPSLEWPKPQSDLCSPKASCPYLLDLEPMSCMRKRSGLSECEVASQSGVSSMTSGEDGDSETETEGDCEFAARERARQVQLPYSVDWIVNLSRNDFQQLLKQQTFTQEQLDFVHDMRRRSKNRLAAQRCRKRKLDCIYNLQCEINKLKTEREKLILEKSQLSQMKVKTCHSVNTLCQRVCGEANLQPEQLQVLAKFTSSDCPLSSFFPHIDMLLSEHGLPLHPHASLVTCSGGFEFASSEKDPSSLNRDTTRGQHSL